LGGIANTASRDQPAVAVLAIRQHLTPHDKKLRKTWKLDFSPLTLLYIVDCFNQEFLLINSHAALFAPEFMSRPTTDWEANPTVCCLGHFRDMQQVDARLALGGL
jgi:hypothetical protein